jgi:hypothetical protein
MIEMGSYDLRFDARNRNNDSDEVNGQNSEPQNEILPKFDHRDERMGAQSLPSSRAKAGLFHDEE